MKIVTIANQKGGVGKTTTTVHLAVALQRQGNRVLVIDSDPQANLSSYLGADPNSGLPTLDALYLAKRAQASDHPTLIRSTRFGVDLIAADQHLSGVEYYLLNRADREQVLKSYLQSLEAARLHYDYVLIDTPPSLNLLTLNALVASHRVLIPVQLEFFSLEGIVKIRDSIAQIRNRWNPGLQILGVLPTQVNARRKLSQEVLSALATEFGAPLGSISDSSAIAESSGHGMTIWEYDRNAKGGAEYDAAAANLIQNWGSA